MRTLFPEEAKDQSHIMQVYQIYYKSDYSNHPFNGEVVGRFCNFIPNLIN